MGTLGDLQRAEPDTLGALSERFATAAPSSSLAPRPALQKPREPFPVREYGGAPDLPLEANPMSPADLLTVFGSLPAGAAPQAGRVLPWLLKAAPRAGVAFGGFGAGSDLAEGRNPLPSLPGNVATGALTGPPLEAAVGLVGPAWRALNERLRLPARPRPVAAPATPLAVAGLEGPAPAIPAPAPAPVTVEPSGLPLARPETGGTTERIFRPEKLGLPQGEDAERRVINAFHGMGLDTRKIRTFGDMRAAAQDLGLSVDDLLRAPQRRPLADAEVVALRNAINDQATVAQQASAQMRAGGLTDEEMRGAQSVEELAQRRIIDALKRLSVGGTETGRAVAAFRIIGQRTLDPAYWYRTAMTQLRGREFTPEIRQVIDNLIGTEDRVGLARFMASLHQSTRTEKAISLWKAGLLSNPATDVANLSGNVFMGAMETLKDVPATVFDMLASVATGQRTKTLSPMVLTEKLGGIAPGLAKAARYLKEGDLAENLLTKYDFNKQTRFDNPILQFYTQAVFRRLGAEDLLFREPALRASVAEQAIVQARNAGLEGRAFLDAVREAIKNPSEKVLAIAQSDADYATFQSKSPLATWLSSARGGWQPVVEGVAPFRRTPINIANAILDYSPFGMPKAAIGWMNRSRAGMSGYLKQKYVVETLGRSVTGTTIAGLGWAMAARGLAVGLPPKDQQERDNRKARGIPNNGVEINGQWITLDRLAPISNIFLLGVNAYEQFERNPTLSGKIGGTAAAVIGTLREQTFLKGVSGLGKAIDQPEQMGGDFIAQLASSIVPSLVGAVARGTDPTQRKQEGIVQGIQSRLPGLRGQLPPVVDVRGRDVRAPKGLAASLASPVTVRPAERDQVARALESSGYGPSMASPILERRGEKLRLSGADLTQFERDTGKALEQAVQQVSSDPSFREADKDEQLRRLKHAADDARARVRNEWKQRKFTAPRAQEAR